MQEVSKGLQILWEWLEPVGKVWLLWNALKWGVTWWRRRPHRVRATATINIESLQTVSSMPDGVRALYDQRRIAGHMVAATATTNGSHLPTEV